MKGLPILLFSAFTSFAYATVDDVDNAHLEALPSISTTIEKENHMVSLNDEELSAVQGQALMNLAYANSTTDSSLGFYKLGMEANVELNANINKLQLGCGGISGPGQCDIDIDNLSLSGNSDNRDGRVGSSALLTNPFIEFAIKNKDNASTREIMGFRLSAEKVIGLLTLGTENSNEKNGINVLSGYLEIAQTGGIAKINPLKNMKPSFVNNQQIQGKACGILVCLPFTTTDYTLNLTTDAAGQSSAPLLANLTLPQQKIEVKRKSSVDLTATAVANNIKISGNIKAVAAGLINLDKNAAGEVDGLNVNVKIKEDLGYIHKIDLNGTPLSLSLQKQNLRWNGSKSVAQQGWWLEFSNPVQIGDITPVETVDIAASTISEALVQISNHLTNVEPVQCGIAGLLSCLFGSTINIGNPNLSNAPAANMSLSNLKLANQSFAPNCYGTLKFC